MHTTTTQSTNAKETCWFQHHPCTEKTFMLCASQKNAHWLRNQWQQYQRQENTCWGSPMIATTMQWMSQMQLFYPSAMKKMTRHQSWALMQSLITEKTPRHQQAATGKLANLYQHAWHHCRLWLGDQAQLKAHQANHAFCQIIDAYEADKKAHNWADELDQWQNLLQQLKADPKHKPDQIIYFGFQPMPPLYDQLKTVCQKNTPHKTLSIEKKSQCHYYAAQNTSHEIQAMCTWAIQWAKDNQQAKIACIISDYSAQVPHIQRHLAMNKQHTQLLTTSFSPYRYLIDLPLIKNLFVLLDGLQEKYTHAQITQLLKQKDFPHDQEAMAAQHILARQWQQTGQWSITLTAFARWSRHQGKKYPALSQWLLRCEQFMVMEKESMQARTALAWSTWLQEWLEALKWPWGQENQSETTKLIYEKWQTQLTQLAAHPRMDNIIDFHTMRQQLHYLCDHTLFGQPNDAGQIQFMSVDEAKGQTFDALWLMSCGQSIWPIKPTQQTLIPNTLLAQLNDPYHSPAKQWQQAHLKIKHIKSNAQHVCMSYSKKNQGITDDISPIVCQTPSTICHLSWPHQQASLALMPIQEAAIPAVSGKISKTSALLTHHIECPFRAFAYHRLQMRYDHYPHLGLDARERGMIVHQMLYYFWHQINDQAALLALLVEEEQQRIDQAIALALKPWRITRSDVGSHFFQQETIRLQKLMHTWLAIEKQRPPFRIHGLEKSITLTLEDVQINMRADRIDELDNQQYLIIDYKTGSNLPSLQAWLAESVTEAQLPLYALAQEQTSAIAIAKLHGPEKKFIGLTAETQTIDGIHGLEKKAANTSWQALQDQWRTALTQYVTQWRNQAPICRPIQKTLCQQCAIRPTCRVHPHR